VIERFRMHESKLVGTLVRYHTKLSVAQVPSTDEGVRDMKTTLYANGVGNIMYEMVCNSRTSLEHVVNVVSKFMTNLGCVH